MVAQVFQVELVEAGQRIGGFAQTVRSAGATVSFAQASDSRVSCYFDYRAHEYLPEAQPRDSIADSRVLRRV